MLKEDILQAQNEWGKGVVQIGKNELEAKEFVSKMYANEVLMKPTMAKEQAFRTNHPDIISYFIGGHISEDNGFALKPWTKVRFENEVKKEDAQRNMAWFALFGMLLYPFAILLASLMQLDQASKTLGSMAPTYFVSVAAIVAAFYGKEAYTKGK